MRSKLYIVIGILFLLPSCFFNSKQKGAKHSFFIQATLDPAVIEGVQNKIQPLVDNIIKEELGIEQDKNFPIFFIKKRYAVTVYYVRDLCDNNEPLRGLMYLFVEPALESLQKPLAPKHATLTSNVKFFGEEKKGLFGATFLVALINDPDKELSLLNKKMKKAMHHANKEYKRAYHIDLYDIAKSEKYPYLPHISLGHLRTNYIKFLVKDASKAEKVLGRIKQRIIKVASDVIANLASGDRKLSFNKLAIYDAKKKKYIKERALE
ncbi:hypothetical protein ACFLYU_04455 [Candidatus Dependentiae bacterium]